MEEKEKREKPAPKLHIKYSSDESIRPILGRVECRCSNVKY